MDAISALVVGMQRSQATVNNAASQIASADLPTASSPGPSAASNPGPSTNVDVADQLTTMMVAADSHHLSATAIKVAMSTYQDILNTAKASAESDGPTSATHADGSR